MPLLLHLADVHLGARHEDMGDAAVAQRERQLAAFRRAIDIGLERGVAAALISGDLFDSNAQPRRSVEATVAELKRLTDAGASVVIIPGTHDVYDGRSIYRAFDLARLAGLPRGSDRLVVLTPERPEMVLRDLDMVVYGRVFPTRRAPRSPLDGFSARADDRGTWKIGLIHGALRIPGKVESDDVIFDEQEIAASGLHYLALGHWHSFLSGRSGDTSWAYPGAVEPMAVDQDGAGNVCLVHLAGGGSDPREIHIEKVRVGQTVFRSESIDAAGIETQEQLIQRLAELADDDLILRVSVEGIAADTLELSTDEVEQALAPSFLHVRVRDRSVTELASGPALPADTVAGKFIRDLESRIRAAEAKNDPAAAEQSRQILRLGRRLLLDDPDHVTLP